MNTDPCIVIYEHKIKAEFSEKMKWYDFEGMLRDELFCPCSIDNPNVSWEYIRNFEKEIIASGRKHTESLCGDADNLCVKVLMNLNVDWEKAKLILQRRDGNPYFWLEHNPNITWDIVQQNRDQPWDFSQLSFNPNINVDVVCDNPDEKWSFDCFSSNETILREIIEDPKKMERFRAIDVHKDFYISPSNPFLTFEIFENYKDEYPQMNAIQDFPWLSNHRNIIWDVIKNNPDKPWSHLLLSRNPNITWDIVENNPDIKWDYTYLSINPNITWDIIKENPSKPWNYEKMMTNPNITLKIIKENPILSQHCLKKCWHVLDNVRVDFKCLNISHNQNLFNDTVFRREALKAIEHRIQKLRFHTIVKTIETYLSF
jgi:hypothetical protein